MQHDVSIVSDLKTLANYFPEAEADEDFFYSYVSGRSTEKGCGIQPVIFLNPVTGKLAWQSMAWGCMPIAVTDVLITAKRWAFLLYTSATRIFGDAGCYWHRIRDQRCLMPVSGIYVHRTVKNVRHKIPYFVHIPDQPVFFLPGLYSVDEAIDKTTGQRVVRWVFTIISRPANDIIKHLSANENKNKPMPLLLPFSLASHWLDHDLSDADYQSILDFEMPSEALQAWPIYSTQPEEQRPDHKEKNERFNW